MCVQQVEYLHQLIEGKHHQRKARVGAKVRISIWARWSGMQQQHATAITTTTDQVMTSTITIGVHDTAINATCVRVLEGEPLRKLQYDSH